MHTRADVAQPLDQDRMQRLVEYAVAFLWLFYFSQAVRVLLHNPYGASTRVSNAEVWRRQALVFVLACAVVYVWSARRQILAFLGRTPALWSLIALSAASSLWSANPRISSRSAIWLLAIGVLGVAFERRFSRRQQLQVLGSIFGVILILSVMFVYLMPSLGLDVGEHAGKWRGVYVHKNLMGAAAGLAALVFTCLLAQQNHHRVLLATGAIASLVVLLLSRAVTAQIACAATALTITVAAAIRVPRLRRQMAVALLVALVAGLSYAAANWAVVTQMLGRDATLSGRTLLWASLIPAIADRPWLGYGVDAFWGGNGIERLALFKAVGWRPPHAHNGFVEVTLDLGVVGLALMVSSLVVALKRSAQLTLRGLAHDQWMWPLGYLVYFTVSNLAEVSILKQNLAWLLYVATVTGLAPSDNSRTRAPRGAHVPSPTLASDSATQA